MSTVKAKPDQDLLQIIHEHNVAKQDVLNYPQNRELMLARDAQVLHEDDELEVPPAQGKWVTVSTNRSHTFVYTPLERHLRIRLLDADQRPLVTDFKLTVDGVDHVGVSEDGYLYADVPMAAKSAKLTLGKLAMTLGVGRLEPVHTVRGAQARLINLGYLATAEPSAAWDELSLGALRAFQLAAHVPVTGVTDLQTLKALKTAAGA